MARVRPLRSIKDKKLREYVRRSRAAHREKVRAHPTHRLTRWHAEILAPRGTARFYAVRSCRRCGAVMATHPAGTFNNLRDPCRGKAP